MKNLYVFLVALCCCVTFSMAQSDDHLETIKSYLLSKSMNSQDVDEIYVQNSSFSKSMKATNVYVAQKYQGIPVKNIIGNFVIKDGAVVRFKGNFVSDIAKKSITTIPSITAEEALSRASSILGLGNVTIYDSSQLKSKGNFVVSKSTISNEEIPIELVFELRDNKMILSWDLTILTKDHQNWYSVRINATDGSLVSQDNLMHHCSFDRSVVNKRKKDISKSSQNIGFKAVKPSVLLNGSYNVFDLPVESPSHGSRSVVSEKVDQVASPFGWHDTDGVAGAEFTITRGNNVWASEDRGASNTPGYSPDGGENLVFDFPFDPEAPFLEYQDASITNLFYINNLTHDIWYQYGFDETSGNFQENNYGNGGQASDAVRAFAQDGSDINNATFGTPGDGRPPVMSMFLWSPEADPNAEGSFIINNSSLQGDYNVLDNAFTEGHVDAPQKPDGITADLVLAIDDDTNEEEPKDPNDACSALTNAAQLVDKIAVVRRGSCNFTAKVQLCQDAGALAVLVVNNDTDNPDEAIPMGGGLATITIPAVMINSRNGEAIITEMETTTINVTLSDPSDNFVFATDGSFDNAIIAHEYGHGISNRLVGGASAANCLFNDEQMGEGWSDWFGLMMTIEPGDTAEDSRGIGTFATGQPTSGRGIRPFPYSTNTTINPVVYGDTNNANRFSQPHGIGSIWASILWDMTWAFIERDGYDSDLYNGTGGNNLAMQLVIDGLKLTPCNPGFVDGRDAILDAADLLPDAEANKCIIWDVFAKRGVGFSATQGSSDNRLDQTEAFDLPEGLGDCQILSVSDIDTNLFTIDPVPSNGIFTIRVPRNFGNSSITVYDMNGRSVYIEIAQLKDSHTVNTSLTRGVYLVKIDAEDNVTTGTFKMVVE